MVIVESSDQFLIEHSQHLGYRTSGTGADRFASRLFSSVTTTDRESAPLLPPPAPRPGYDEERRLQVYGENLAEVG